ncbi:MAG: hypothetical protein JWP52_844 [Rhizobacter sp.]|jgi:DNA-binding NarL/FixJ family response regulator|nr:hypothetical protein [Rhizobacter sp.]
MRLLMIDDHVLFLQGLKTLLGELAPELSIDLAETSTQALHLAASTTYHLVLMDWHLEGGDARDCIARLRDIGCAARVVVLSGETRPALIREAIEVGAAGFVPKKYNSDLMLAALSVVIQGGIYLPPEALREAPPALSDLAGRMAQLTSRQQDVYRAAARGLPNKLIARELGIAESTVKTHLTAVYAVLGVTNRTQAAYQASREGVHVG